MKAFVRLINDTNQNINRIWSDHFEITDFENKKKDNIISFYPVYTYDWLQKGRSYYPYEINEVHINLTQQDGSLVTFDLPKLSKGDCETIRISQLRTTK